MNILKTIVAFTNTAGGIILIGRDYETRKPVAITYPLETKKRLCNLITNGVVPRIFRETVELGFQEPSIVELGLRVRFIFPLAEALEVSKTARSRPESGVESGMALQVISFLKEKPLSKSEIAKQLGKAKPTRYLHELMARLMREGYVEYTIPEKPNSLLQKYWLTIRSRKTLRYGEVD